jgi:DNA-binding MarR family transcriptional regulator
VCWERSTRAEPSDRLCNGVVVGRLDLAVSHTAAVSDALRRAPRGWTFITNHAQVLLVVAQRPDVRVREIAAAACITERYAYQMLRDLEDAGYVERRRDGRCNRYRVHPDLALGDPIVERHALRELLRLVEADESDELVAKAAARTP